MDKNISKGNSSQSRTKRAIFKLLTIYCYKYDFSQTGYKTLKGNPYQMLLLMQ